MRELILLRHAHAEPATAGQSDLDRPLSGEGLAEAESAGRWLAEHKLVPDCVLCSPSRRARETLEAVLGAIGDVDQRIGPSIYEATPGTLIALADNHNDVGRLMMVGHNPGFEQLAALLHSGQSGDHRGIPPAGVVVLSFPAGIALEPGVAQLSAFWWP
jgi:phosphohistidine phosphatase SixA